MATNAYGQPVEEFEIQFIDGPNIAAQLFNALSVSQVAVEAFLEVTDNWNTEEKVRVIVAIWRGRLYLQLGFR